MQSLPGFTRHKAYRKRASGRARLSFPGGFQLAVSMYSLVQPATKGSPVFLNAVNNEPLKVESAFIDQDTGALPTASASAAVLVWRPFVFLCCARLWGSQHAGAVPPKDFRLFVYMKACTGSIKRLWSEATCKLHIPLAGSMSQADQLTVPAQVLC